MLAKNRFVIKWHQIASELRELGVLRVIAVQGSELMGHALPSLLDSLRAARKLKTSPAFS
jgi:hypothetical protein